MVWANPVQCQNEQRAARRYSQKLLSCMVRKHVCIADVLHYCISAGVTGYRHDLVHPRVMDRCTGDEACPQGVGGELGRVQPNGRGIPFHQARNVRVVERAACESSAPAQ